MGKNKHVLQKVDTRISIRKITKPYLFNVKKNKKMFNSHDFLIIHPRQKDVPRW